MAAPKQLLGVALEGCAPVHCVEKSNTCTEPSALLGSMMKGKDGSPVGKSLPNPGGSSRRDRTTGY